MAKETILIVEDDEDILELISYNLNKNAYKVLSSSSGENGLEKLEKNNPELILLDLMLPGIDGFEFCKKVKANEKTKNIPIIMLTARGEDADIVTGLELGADDYITKPFSPSILIARIKSVLRRNNLDKKQDDGLIIIDELTINPLKHEVSVNGKIIDLTSNEFQVLSILAKKPGWPMTRYQIVNLTKGEEYSVTDRAVDVMMVGLRKKLGEYGKYIETVRGVGYKFKENN